MYAYFKVGLMGDNLKKKGRFKNDLEIKIWFRHEQVKKGTYRSDIGTAWPNTAQGNHDNFSEIVQRMHSKIRRNCTHIEESSLFYLQGAAKLVGHLPTPKTIIGNL